MELHEDFGGFGEVFDGLPVDVLSGVAGILNLFVVLGGQ